MATGVWRYDDIAPTTVSVVMLDYDFWHEIAEADGEAGPDEAGPDEAAELNDEGRLYYVRHRPGWREGEPFWPDSPGFRTRAEAIAAAESAVPARIVWQ